jgi:hypothetical protein
MYSRSIHSSEQIVDVIIDIPPLAEFVPLIWLIKPTFIFDTRKIPERMLSLLKVVIFVSSVIGSHQQLEDRQCAKSTH